jgi:hypothetical protein
LNICYAFYTHIVFFGRLQLHRLEVHGLLHHVLNVSLKEDIALQCGEGTLEMETTLLLRRRTLLQRYHFCCAHPEVVKFRFDFHGLGDLELEELAERLSISAWHCVVHGAYQPVGLEMQRGCLCGAALTAAEHEMSGPHAACNAHMYAEVTDFVRDDLLNDPVRR